MKKKIILCLAFLGGWPMAWAHAGSISGRVVDQYGAAVEGVRLDMEEDTPSSPKTWVAWTDAEGQFEQDVPQEVKKRYTVTPSHPLVPDAVFEAVYESAYGKFYHPDYDYVDLLFVMYRPSMVSGRVVRVDGKVTNCLAGVQVQMERDDVSFTAVSTTDQHGEFSFYIPVGVDARIFLSADGECYPPDFQPSEYTLQGNWVEQAYLDFVMERRVAWSTYLGGGGYNDVAGIATDDAGNTYIVGTTDSPGWARTGWRIDHGGGRDAFLAKLDAAGEHLWSTYLGGAGDDEGKVVVVSPGGVFVAGNTRSDGWVSGGLLTEKWQRDRGLGFLVKLTPSGEHVWSTYLGYCEVDAGAWDAQSQRLVLTGWTEWRNEQDCETCYSGWWDGRESGGHYGGFAQPGTVLWMEVPADGSALFVTRNAGYRGCDVQVGPDGGTYVVARQEESLVPVLRRHETGLGALQVNQRWRVEGATNWVDANDALALPEGEYRIEFPTKGRGVFAEHAELRPANRTVQVERGKLNEEIAHYTPLQPLPTASWRDGPLWMANSSTIGEYTVIHKEDGAYGNYEPCINYFGNRDVRSTSYRGSAIQAGAIEPEHAGIVDFQFAFTQVVELDNPAREFTISFYRFSPGQAYRQGWTPEGYDSRLGFARLVYERGGTNYASEWLTNETVYAPGGTIMEVATIDVGSREHGWTGRGGYVRVTNFPSNFEWESKPGNLDVSPRRLTVFPDMKIGMFGFNEGVFPSISAWDGDTSGFLYEERVGGQVPGWEAMAHDMTGTSRDGRNLYVLTGRSGNLSWLGGSRNWSGAYLWLQSEDENGMLADDYEAYLVHPGASGRRVTGSEAEDRYIVAGTTDYAHGGWNVENTTNYPGGDSAVFVTKMAFGKFEVDFSWGRELFDFYRAPPDMRAYIESTEWSVDGVNWFDFTTTDALALPVGFFSLRLRQAGEPYFCDKKQRYYRFRPFPCACAEQFRVEEKETSSLAVPLGMYYSWDPPLWSPVQKTDYRFVTAVPWESQLTCSAERSERVNIDRIIGTNRLEGTGELDLSTLKASGALGENARLVVSGQAREGGEVWELYINGEKRFDDFRFPTSFEEKIEKTIPIEWLDFQPEPSGFGLRPSRMNFFQFKSADGEIHPLLITELYVEIDVAPPIVFIHGINSNQEAWNEMRAFVDANLGIPNYAFTLEPGGGLPRNFLAIRANARQVAEELTRCQVMWGVDKINIVSHSKGGLDSKHYTNDDLLYQDNVWKLIQIATPNDGSQLATVGTRLLGLAKNASIPAIRKVYDYGIRVPFIAGAITASGLVLADIDIDYFSDAQWQELL